MFKQIVEYREMQQLRKDHLMQKKQRMMFVILAILGVVLLATYVVKTVMPTNPVKAAAAVSTVDAAKQQELSDIEEFADIVTKPSDQLESTDFDLVGKKAHDPCYEKNALLPREEMIVAITACKFPK